MTITPELARRICTWLRTVTPKGEQDGKDLHAVVEWLEGAARLDSIRSEWSERRVDL